MKKSFDNFYYRKIASIVVLLSVANVPLGVFIGYMMALGNAFWVVGIVVLMLFDYIGSKAWLTVIRKEAKRLKRK